jgi:hypothetical protein
MRKLLVVGLLCAFPVAGTLSFAGTAVAKSTGVSCTGLSGTIASTGKVKISLSGCSDTKNTGGKGTEKTKETSTSGTITWDGTGTTTYDNSSYSGVSNPTCPSSDIEEQSTGDIDGGTGAAANSIKKGWTFQADVCYDASAGTLSLAPGTTYEIGASY